MPDDARFGPPKRVIGVKRSPPGHDEGATLPGSPGINEVRVLVIEVWVEEVVLNHPGLSRMLLATTASRRLARQLSPVD